VLLILIPNPEAAQNIRRYEHRIGKLKCTELNADTPFVSFVCKFYGPPGSTSDVFRSKTNEMIVFVVVSCLNCQ